MYKHNFVVINESVYNDHKFVIIKVCIMNNFVVINKIITLWLLTKTMIINCIESVYNDHNFVVINESVYNDHLIITLWLLTKVCISDY